MLVKQCQVDSNPKLGTGPPVLGGLRGIDVELDERGAHVVTLPGERTTIGAINM